MKPKALMLMAHPDDEIIFGWPMLFSDQFDKEILCVSNDRDNPERAWCQHRGEALNGVAEFLDICAVSLDFPSGFYRTPTRRAPRVLSEIIQFVLGYIGVHEFDFIFTHNPYGEYGHIDHILVNQLAMQTDNPVIYTDICLHANWLPFSVFSETYREAAFHSPLLIDGKECHTPFNAAKYQEIEEIYRRWGCWTWSRPPITEARLYSYGNNLNKE